MHPVRRRIIRDLIIAGNLGIFSALTSILVALLREDPEGGLEVWHKALIVVAGALVLTMLVRTRPARRLLDRTVARMVERVGVVRPADVELLLRVHHGYVVSEVAIEREHWLIGRTLRRSGLSDIGILVLGVTRSDASYVGTPGPETDLRAGDVLTVYGREADVQAFTARREAPDVARS